MVISGFIGPREASADNFEGVSLASEVGDDSWLRGANQETGGRACRTVVSWHPN